MQQALQLWAGSKDDTTGLHNYAAVYELFSKHFPEIPHASIRRRLMEYKRSLIVAGAGGEAWVDPPPQYDIVVDPAFDAELDPETLWETFGNRAQRIIEKYSAPPTRFAFDHGPVCLVFISDQHIGSPGADYYAMRRDAEIINATPGMYCGQTGDLVDNMIVGKLSHIRAIGGGLSIPEEWALAEYYIKMLAPKLLWHVGGNHDAWTTAVAGIDQLAHLNKVASKVGGHRIIYDPDELNVVVSIESNTGVQEFPIRIRHKWKGNSMFNVVHGQQQAARFDNEIPYRIAVGAHTHRGFASSLFPHNGKTLAAMQSHTYKVIDQYKRQNQFYGGNNGTAACIILEEDGSMALVSGIEQAARWMDTLYDR